MKKLKCLIVYARSIDRYEFLWNFLFWGWILTSLFNAKQWIVNSFGVVLGITSITALCWTVVSFIKSSRKQREILARIRGNPDGL